MTIKPQDVAAFKVGALLSRDLQIPAYQRPYSWRAATAVQLLDDVLHAESSVRVPGSPASCGNDVDADNVCNAPVQPYVLGTVILHRSEDRFDIVDGQQRTLTLRMLHMLLEEPSFDRTISTRLEQSAESAIGKAWSALHRRADDLTDRAAIAHFLRHHCEVVVVVTDDIDEAFRVFDSQNHRGKSLLPHDLLKAHHLREMRQESDSLRAAVIEKWEEIDAGELDRLFSTYLYRIRRWSNGQDGTRFGLADIDIFKGISSDRRPSPWELYHLVAQSAIPLLEVGRRDLERRSLDHARFQLDAPIRAGRHFFEMTMFMYQELQDLYRTAFPETSSAEHREGTSTATTGPALPGAEGRTGFNGFSASPLVPDHRGIHPRFRYVTDLYLASLLFTVNKFGPDAAAGVDRMLFRWAYSLRVKHQRVLARSVENHGKDERSPFSVLRNARSILEAHMIEGVDLEEPTGRVAEYRTTLRHYLVEASA